MAIHKLNPRKVATVGAGKYEDGGGLRLVVSSTGARKWVLRYTIHGKRREMGLGSMSEVSLAQAREDAALYRGLAKKGIDPIAHRDSTMVAVPTFSECAAEYIESHKSSWSNQKHIAQWSSTIKTYVEPVVGARSVDAVTTEDLLKILRPIWESKTETAKRVQGRIENILDYAAAHNFRNHVNPARWRGHLDKLLPKPSKLKKERHHPAMPYQEISEFYLGLSDRDSYSSYALRLLILTATRTSEVLNATWGEFNLEDKVWVIPADRMKMKREHRIPLSDAAMSVIDKVVEIKRGQYLFPSGKRKRDPVGGGLIDASLSNMALLQLMRKLGYGVNGDMGPYVPHGFRSSFRDWSGEVSSYPRDVAEMALAHTIQNKVEAAYRRGDLFEKRKKMMQEWGEFVDEQ